MSTAGHPITKAALSKYELFKSVPRATFLVALAELLGVRTSYFLEQEKATVKWIAFRKLFKMPQKKQEQVAEGLITKDRAEQICQGCTLELEALGPVRFP